MLDKRDKSCVQSRLIAISSRVQCTFNHVFNMCSMYV